MSVAQKRCSSTDLKQYKKSINRYLKTKSINDFTKYEISIKSDGVHFIKWDYPNIEKPTLTKITTPHIENFVDFYFRAIYFDVNKTPIRANTKYNARGEIVDEVDIDVIESINDIEITTPSGLYLSAPNKDLFHATILKGLLVFPVAIEKSLYSSFSGKFRVLFCYSKNPKIKSTNYSLTPASATVYPLTPNVMNLLV